MCSKPAGWRTDHPGEGRCYLHGGATPVKHGRYSTIKTTTVGELLEKHRADPDPLNVHDDLALLRALIEDYVARNVEYATALLEWNRQAALLEQRPHRLPDLIEAASLLEVISRVVERVEKTRNANHISRADFNRIVHEYWRAVDARVLDVVTKGKIREDWLSVRL